MLRDKPEDAEVLAYGEALVAELNRQSAFGYPVRAILDKKPLRSAEKRWNWVRKGAPVIVEIGPRDAAGGNVTWIRRDQLRDGEKVKSMLGPRDDFVGGAAALLKDIQQSLFDEAKARLQDNIIEGVTTFDALADYFTGADEAFKGWVRVAWAAPTGDELEGVVQRLKALKVTIRNAPSDQPAGDLGACVFTGRPATEAVYIARAY
jgi:prolyl-tRNA synthetase